MHPHYQAAIDRAGPVQYKTAGLHVSTNECCEHAVGAKTRTPCRVPLLPPHRRPGGTHLSGAPAGVARQISAILLYVCNMQGAARSAKTCRGLGERAGRFTPPQ